MKYAEDPTTESRTASTIAITSQPRFTETEKAASPHATQNSSIP
jgi:hypothetical protein